MKKAIFIIMPEASDSTVDVLETLRELNGSDYASYGKEVIFLVDDEVIDEFVDVAYGTAKENNITITLYDGKPELGVDLI